MLHNAVGVSIFPEKNATKDSTHYEGGGWGSNFQKISM